MKVCNPWLWGFDLKLRQGGGEGFLGDYSHVIVDEAHKIHDGLRAAFTSRMGEKQMSKTINRCATKLGIDVQYEGELLDSWDDMFATVKQFKKKDTTVSLEDLPTDKIEAVLKVLTKQYNKLEEIRSPDATGFHPNAAQATFLFGTLLDCVKALYSPQSINGQRVCFMKHEYFQWWITVAPIDVNWILGQYNHMKSFTYMSATLAVGGSTDYFARSMGHDPADCTELLLPTVFDMKKQALLYVSKNVPQPTRAEDRVYDYRRKLADEIVTLVQASDGNALVLFTARDHMGEVASMVRGKIKNQIFTQDGGVPPAVVLRKYLNTDNSVLFGLKSFFEGVNIPGQKLSLVVITCLPFPGRTDPVVQAQREKVGSKWFPMVDLPSCELDVRQAAGRLIRTNTDRGVVALLDSRAVTKRYAKRIRNSLGIPNITTNLNATVKTLQSLPKE